MTTAVKAEDVVIPLKLVRRIVKEEAEEEGVPLGDMLIPLELLMPGLLKNLELNSRNFKSNPPEPSTTLRDLILLLTSFYAALGMACVAPNKFKEFKEKFVVNTEEELEELIKKFRRKS